MYTSLKISGVASQFAMQNSGIATPEVEVYSSFDIPKSVKNLMEFNRTANVTHAVFPYCILHLAYGFEEFSSGRIFHGDEFSGDKFSRDEFSSGTNFPHGQIFWGQIFGDKFSGANFPVKIKPCLTRVMNIPFGQSRPTPRKLMS
jgi:hypothetical protein